MQALEASDRVGRIASVDALAVCSRPRLLPCCCDQHGLVAAHPENRLCETMAQHPELIWIKTVHVLACVEIKILRRVRVVLHAIDATPAGWRSGAGSSPPNGPSTAASSPRNDFVKNYRVHPTHWLISTQVLAFGLVDQFLAVALRLQDFRAAQPLRVRLLLHGLARAAVDVDVGDLVAEDADAPGLRRLCLLYTSPSPRDVEESRMPSSA